MNNLRLKIISYFLYDWEKSVIYRCLTDNEEKWYKDKNQGHNTLMNLRIFLTPKLFNKDSRN